MQALLFPAIACGGAPLSSISTNPSQSYIHRAPRPSPSSIYSHSLPPLSSLKTRQSLSSSCSSHITLGKRPSALSSSPTSTAYTSPYDDSEKAKLAQVAKRLEGTARYFKRLGSLGFWGQLICTNMAGGILSFSIVVAGKINSLVTFYATAGGLAAAFISVFWSFGYIRLADKLRKTANDPSKAPPRADVVKSLKNGIVLNLVGMSAAILGMQATMGWLVAKALTSSANPYLTTSVHNPVLGLDVFLAQASASTILSHFLGLVCSLELLRSVTLAPSESIPVPRIP